MKTDIQCKVLARLRPEDLLVLVGDPGAQVLSTEAVELQEIKRTVDFVFKLQRDQTVYYHHIEFQGQSDDDICHRCFLYDALLLDHFRAPVRTTIIWLLPECRPREPVFRVDVAGQEINRWQFHDVRLWELKAQEALDQGLLGLVVFVPLMKGATVEHLQQAVHQIETTAPSEQQTDLLAILRAFGESKYTVEQLERIIGRKRLMESSIYKWGLTEGQAQGRAEGLVAGQLEVARELCREAVRKWHPRAGKRVWAAIEQCTDIAVLKEVNLNAPEWSTRDILRRLTKH